MTDHANNPMPPPGTRPIYADYRPDIDGLRAVAVMSVIFYHAAPGWMPGGFVGVDIFFVISGFLITAIIVSGLERDRFSFVDFYARRIRRIFPALALLMFSCLATGILLFTPDELAALGKHVLAGSAFVSNLALWSEAGYFDSSTIFKPLIHLWSLGVEEQFYLVWPALLYASSRLGRHRWTMLAMISMMAATSFVWSVYQSSTSPIAAYFSPFSRFWEPFVGALVTLGIRHRSFDFSLTVRNVLSFSGSIMVIAAFAFVDDNKPFPGLWATLPTFGAAALIIAGPEAWVNRQLLSVRPMVSLGLISYPLYLWHWPLIVVPRIFEGSQTPQLTRLVAVVAAILLAWVTYRFVELPVRRGRAGRATIPLLSALICSAALAGGGAWITGGLPTRPWAPVVINSGEIGAPPYFRYVADHFYPCTPLEIRRRALSGEEYLRCPQSRPSSDHDIAIIGDSHAESLFPGLAEVLPNQNVVFYGIGNGLPFLSNPDYSPIFDTVIASKSVKTVLIAAAWPRKLKLTAEDTWSFELSATIERLRLSGKAVYLVDDVPAFSFLPSRCKFSGRFGLPPRCEESYKDETDYEPIFDAIARKTGAKRLYLHRLFCSGRHCFMARHGVLLFRDDNHLSLAGSRFAGNAIFQMMVAAGDPVVTRSTSKPTSSAR